MGLDLVEFTLAVEDAFGLFIPDADAVHITTPLAMVEYLLPRLQSGPQASCLEQRAFYRLRRAGIQVLDRPREAFTPTTPWADLLHPKHQARQWRLLGQTTAITPWPRLKFLLSWGPTAKTVGDTARELAMTAAPALMQPGEGWNRQAVETIIRRLMMEELAVMEFQWTDRFVEDLGCG